MDPTPDERTYNLEELAATAGVNPRTVRYYIQLELVDPPVGQTRAARYGWQHLRQLLEVRRLTEQGFSLDRVRELLAAPAQPAVHEQRSPRPGEVAVRSHIHLAPGLELVIDPGQVGLTAEALRRLVRDLLAVYAGHAKTAGASDENSKNRSSS